MRRLTADGVVEPKAKRQQVSKGKPAQDAGGDGTDEQKVPAVEEGTIYFLYRPRVGFEEVQSLSDVQRFYLVSPPCLVFLANHDRERLCVDFFINSIQMHPHILPELLYSPHWPLHHITTFALHAGESSQVMYCLQVLDPEKGGKKKRVLVIGKKKVPAKKERFFGFIQSISDDIGELTGGMGKESHETANGTRTTEASRIAGEGKCVSLCDHRRSGNKKPSFIFMQTCLVVDENRLPSGVGTAEECEVVHE